MDVPTKMALFASAGGMLRIETPDSKPRFEVIVQASARRNYWVERLIATRTIEVTLVDGSNLLMEAIEECIDELAANCPALRDAGLPVPAPLPQE